MAGLNGRHSNTYIAPTTIQVYELISKAVCNVAKLGVGIDSLLIGKPVSVSQSLLIVF